jgi:hypothetical protein
VTLDQRLAERLTERFANGLERWRAGAFVIRSNAPAKRATAGFPPFSFVVLASGGWMSKAPRPP